MIRYLLVMAMIILTPPKGNGGLPLAPKPAVVEARVWDKLAAALSFVESRDDDRAYNATSGALGRWQMKKVYVDEVNRILCLKREKKRYRYDDRTNPVKAREMVDIQEDGDVLDSQGAGRGRIGLGHILYPVLWIGGRDAN